MTRPASQIPDPADRAALSAALHATGAGTGFWDEHGRPAPWPGDIDEWRPATGELITRQPGEQPL